MKKSDWIFLCGAILFFGSFILIKPLFDFYWLANMEYPYIMAYIKFFLLAPVGEMIGLRIRKGVYYEIGFGLFPRAVIWGILGISLKMAFDIFSVGTPYMLQNMGLPIPADILEQPISLKKVFVAFSIGATLNLFYAPILMVMHKITDEHIHETHGKAKGLLIPIDFGKQLRNLNWTVQWEFVFKRTIPLFWIPAQTVNFLFPDEVRILIAAFYSIILGVLLAIASVKSKENR